MPSFQLEARGPFSLAASARFLTGWGPGESSTASEGQHLHLAFVPDGEERAIGVCLTARDTAVAGEVFGDADPHAAGEQVRRILSLDIDGAGWPEVGQRDPVIGRLQQRYPGLRPVLFFSPFEAAVWAVLSQRVQMGQAVEVKALIAEELGETVTIHGQRLQAFPGPAAMLELPPLRGMFGRKLEFLQGLAHAALNGDLDTDLLRGMPEDEALADLKRLPGVGDFSSRLILIRGAGLTDARPAPERRFLRALRLAYDLDHEPGEAEIESISDAWRPYRTWATVLLRVMLADES